MNLLVNFEIFKTAAFHYNSGDVIFLSASNKSVRFLVNEKQVRIEITPTGTRFVCECEHHMNHQLQDKLCYRILCCIMYVYFKKGFFKTRREK